MYLTDYEISLVLQKFPKFELSYETMTHKKVHNADVCLAIPEGNKFFAWFTNYKNNDVCFLLEINNNKIQSCKIVKTTFINDLSIGTIFYGTLFNHNGINCFCIEDLYFYKSKSYIYTPYLNKLHLLKEILRNELTQSILDNNFTIFGLPLITNDFNLLLKDIQLLPYKINLIKFRFFEKNNSRKIMSMKYYKPTIKNNIQNTTKDKNMITTAIFKITADIEPDIYNLFMYKNGIEEYYDVAFISDYKTSVMMNKLFRNIKENDNLDAIEESDDEEEFENNREDKFVYLDRSYKMICEYSYRFKRWCPISLAKENDKIVSSTQLTNKI
jgi:hypothetical protein